MNTRALVLIVLLAFGLNSCAAVKKNIITGGGTAAAAAGGAFLGGPLGAGGAALLYYLVVANSTENQELRDGDITGEGALRKQIDMWKGKALAAEEQVDVVAKIANHASVAEHEARSLLATVWLWTKIGAAAFAAWFGFRNRAHLFTFGRGWAARVFHAFVGASRA